jgi:Adenylate and Guanylate cyclase catalytic domain
MGRMGMTCSIFDFFLLLLIFTDIIGFTSWSSKRTPADVFRLLETIYGAWDAIAARRRVSFLASGLFRASILQAEVGSTNYTYASTSGFQG